MVEVFKTNVTDKNHATKLVELLHRKFPGCKINFDLDDCDKVLRIEGPDADLTEPVRLIINENGFICEVLE